MKEVLNDSNKKIKLNHNLRVAERAIKKSHSKIFGMEEKILGCNEIL